MTQVRVVKTSIALPLSYREKLKKGAQMLGISQSELLRRALDDYLLKLGLSVIGGGENEGPS